MQRRIGWATAKIGRAALIAGALAGLLLPTATNAAGDTEPQLPNPQWRATPHSRAPAAASGEPVRPATTADLPADVSRAGIPPPALPAEPASFEERCAPPGVA